MTAEIAGSISVFFSPDDAFPLAKRSLIPLERLFIIQRTPDQLFIDPRAVRKRRHTQVRSMRARSYDKC